VGLGGVEPPTSRLSGVRSNHLSYSPPLSAVTPRQGGPRSTQIKNNRVVLLERGKHSESRRFERASSSRMLSARFSLGGDPAAPSGTATLLRLSPSHRIRLRPLPPRRVGSRTSGAPGFHGLTGGVYKARERIHRVIADTRLLAIPASWSRVADSNPN
jgi:hypothetical protein